jgi:hypothetical protein
MRGKEVQAQARSTHLCLCRYLEGNNGLQGSLPESWSALNLVEL